MTTGRAEPSRQDPAPPTTLPVGEFTYRTADDRWTWSDSIYAMFGFEPGQVVPTSALIRAHVHPEDRREVFALVAHSLATGQPFSGRHRVVDAHQRVRTLLAVGRTDQRSGQVVGVEGMYVDLTQARATDLRSDMDQAVADFRSHAARIEQAKGVLVQLLSVPPDDAFRILSTCSQHGNIKIRGLAELLVAAAARDETPVKHSKFDILTWLRQLAEHPCA